MVEQSIITKSIAYASTTVGDQATPILAGVVGKRIRIYSIAVSISIGGTNCYIRNGVGGTPVTETFLRTLSGSSFPAYYPRTAYQGIWLYTAEVDKGLILNCTTAAALVSVSLVYAYI